MTTCALLHTCCLARWRMGVVLVLLFLAAIAPCFVGWRVLSVCVVCASVVCVRASCFLRVCFVCVPCVPACVLSVCVLSVCVRACSWPLLNRCRLSDKGAAIGAADDNSTAVASLDPVFLFNDELNEDGGVGGGGAALAAAAAAASVRNRVSPLHSLFVDRHSVPINSFRSDLLERFEQYTNNAILQNKISRM